MSSKNTQNAEDVSIRVLSREEARDLDRYMNAMLPNGEKLVGAEHTPTHANNKTYDSIVDGDWVLTNCTVKHIGGTANVILKGCEVDTISGNAVVELSTGDTINSISEAAILQKAVGSTVHSITESVLLHSFERGKIDFINTSTQLWDIEKSTILHITGDTHIVNIHDSTVNSIAGHTRVDTIDNTLVSEIGDYAVIKLIHECSVRELKGSAIIQLVDASKIYNVSGDACIGETKDKVDTTPTLWKQNKNDTTDTTPTLWKQNNTVDVQFSDHYTEKRNEAIACLIRNLQGIRVLDETNDHITLHVENNRIVDMFAEMKQSGFL